MIIAITGGSGFIGSLLVDKHLKQGDQVRLLSRNILLERKNVQYFLGDLSSSSVDLSDFVDSVDILYHCAGEVNNESLMQELHVNGTQRLIDAAQGKIGRWVQLSSVGAYGPSRPVANIERVVTEETPTNPIGMYEVTKTLADELIIQASKDGWFTYSILRPSNVFGKDMPNSSIRQLGRMIRSNLFFYIGKPGAVSNYVHVDDVAEALALCGFDSRAKNQVFNLSNDCDQAIVINALAEKFNVSVPRLRMNESFVRFISFLFSWLPMFPLKKSRIDSLVGKTLYSTDKIERMLKFKPLFEVKNTIVEVLK